MTGPSALPYSRSLPSSLQTHMEALVSPREGGESAGLGPAGAELPVASPWGCRQPQPPASEASISPEQPSALWVEPEANGTQQAARVGFPGHSQ